MIYNAQTLLEAAPIVNMETSKKRDHGVSYGLAEAGYDIRLKQDIRFIPKMPTVDGSSYDVIYVDGYLHTYGRFVLASAIEEFDMPDNLVGVVHDKSTWARHGLSVFNTVVEPSWNGFLTLELVYFGPEILHIPAGVGIAQVLFHHTAESGKYEGKYQSQANKPVAAILE